MTTPTPNTKKRKPMTVTIDGVEYIPLSTLSKGADETAKAIIRALTSGYYDSPECHVDGGDPKPLCDCSGCHISRVAIQFLGGKPECDEEKDPGFKQLYISVA